jgi:2-oxoglutarate/2-oxoacid ferredoxin oxidoreductase subunit beta
LAHLLARMEYPDFPVPIGVFRALVKPTYETLMEDQGKEAIRRFGPGSLEKLLKSGETWDVE